MAGEGKRADGVSSLFAARKVLIMKKVYIGILLSLFIFSGAGLPGFEPASSQVALDVSLQLTYPNGGECFTPGQTVTITWIGSGYDHVAIGYRKESQGAPLPYALAPADWNIAHPAFGSSYNWNTTGLAEGVAYKVWVEGHNAAHTTVGLADSSNSAFGFAKTCDAAGNTPPATDTTPPSISNVQQTNITSSGVIITFITNEVSFVKIEYGLSTALGSSTNLTATAQTSHSVTLSGLQAGTTYIYKVVAKDAAGNFGFSAGHTFITAAATTPPPSPTDTTSPAVSLFEPLSGAIVSGTIILKANSSDNVGVSKVEFYKGTSFLLGSDFVSPYEYSWDTTQVPNGTYALFAKAHDTSNNSAVSSSVSVTISNSSSTPPNDTTVVPPPPQSSLETATLTGKIFDPDLKPLGGVYINVHTQDHSIFFSGPLSGADGSYTIAAITPGTYAVSTYPPQDRPDVIAPDPVTQTFVAGGTVTKDFLFTRSSKILKGRVLAEDGAPVVDAMVWAYNETTNLGKSADVDSLGNYSLSLKGGTWNVGIEPKDRTSARWSYSKPAEKVIFLDDVTSETKILNFTVTKTDSFVKGRFVNPNGTAPDPAKVSFGLRSTAGHEVFAQLSATGIFSTAVPAGSYEVNIWVNDPAVKAPKLPPVSVASGATVDLGIITLISVSDHIKGRASTFEGTPLSNIRVVAWIPDGQGFSEVKTLSTGEYDLLVTPGTWEVRVEPDPALSYTYTGEPRRVAVTSGVTATGVNFILTLANAIISGKVVNSSGVLIEGFYGFAYALDPLKPASSGGGGPIERGRFTFKVPAGAYKIGVDVPPGSEWSAGLPQSISVASGQTANVAITLRSNDAKITGTLRDAFGSPVKGVLAEVFAGNEQGAWQRGELDTVTGVYTIKVSAGTWHVGVHVDSSLGYVSPGESTLITITSGQTLTKDLLLIRAVSTLNVTVRDPDANPLPNAWVSVDKVGFSTGEKVNPENFRGVFVTGGSTNSQGIVSLRVPQGTFFIHGFTTPEKGFINPKEVKVLIDKEGDRVDVILQFRKASFTLSGRVLLNNAGAEAFVWAWSDGGGYSETRSSSTGSYTLSVTGNDRWHIGADKYTIDSREKYYSSEHLVSVGENSVSGRDIVLVKSSLAVPDSVSKTVGATEVQAVSLEDGAKVVVPANSFGTAGNVTVALTPTTELAKQGIAQAVGVGYNIEARDESGQLVKKLNSALTVTLPYTDAALKEAGVNADDLSAAFWDETVSTWRKLENAVNNRANKRVTATIDHLTRFALIAPAVAAAQPSSSPVPDGTPLVEKVVTSAENLREGDLIRGPDGIKVYIINDKGYKRHIFNPVIFNMYGHLKWGNIKEVSQVTLDLYAVSDLYRADIDPKVYSLEEVNEAAGVAIKHWLDMTPERFLGAGYKWQQVFTVNEKERDYYETGNPIK